MFPALLVYVILVVTGLAYDVSAQTNKFVYPGVQQILAVGQTVNIQWEASWSSSRLGFIADDGHSFVFFDSDEQASSYQWTVNVNSSNSDSEHYYLYVVRTIQVSESFPTNTESGEYPGQHSAHLLSCRADCWYPPGGCQLSCHCDTDCYCRSHRFYSKGWPHQVRDHDILSSTARHSRFHNFLNSRRYHYILNKRRIFIILIIGR